VAVSYPRNTIFAFMSASSPHSSPSPPPHPPPPLAQHHTGFCFQPSQIPIPKTLPSSITNTANTYKSNLNSARSFRPTSSCADAHRWRAVHFEKPSSLPPNRTNTNLTRLVWCPRNRSNRRDASVAETLGKLGAAEDHSVSYAAVFDVLGSGD